MEWYITVTVFCIKYLCDAGSLTLLSVCYLVYVVIHDLSIIGEDQPEENTEEDRCQLVMTIWTITLLLY